MANEPRKPVTWRKALTIAMPALWAPFVVTILLNHQVRRFWEDIWFWPGMLPGKFFFDDIYDEQFVVFAIANLIVWTVVCRRWPRFGVVGAHVHGAYSSLYLCALAAF